MSSKPTVSPATSTNQTSQPRKRFTPIRLKDFLKDDTIEEPAEDPEWDELLRNGVHAEVRRKGRPVTR